MLKKGVCLCPYCGETSTEAYYTVPRAAVGAMLKKSKGLRRHYILEPYSPKNLPVDGYKFEILTKKHNLENVPDTIKVKYTKSDYDGVILDEAIVYMNRSCPNCEDHKQFMTSAGKSPTYVVACVGNSGSGKSCWSAALCYALDVFNACSDDILINHEITIEYGDKAGATNRDDDIGKTNCFTICNKNTPEIPIATVFLIDTAGENYKSENLTADSPLSRIINGNGDDYEGIDGVIFIDPITSNRDNASPVHIFGSPMVRNKITSVPVAYIRTFADKLIGNKPDSILLENTFPKISLNSGIYRNKPCFAPQTIADRIKLQHILYTSAPKGAITPSPVYHDLAPFGKTHVFLVQSCSYNKAANTYNSEEQFNVLDPMFWLIDKMILSSLNEGGIL